MADLRIGEARLLDEEQDAPMRTMARQVAAGDDYARFGGEKLVNIACVAEDRDFVTLGTLERRHVIDHHCAADRIRRLRRDMAGDVAESEWPAATKKPWVRQCAGSVMDALATAHRRPCGCSGRRASG